MVWRAVGLFLLALPQGPPAPRTHVYKVTGGVEVKLDVYRPDTSQVLPVVVWIHGGALVMGSRSGVPRNLREFCQAEGFALVSIDYRLAPQVKLTSILEDVKEAFRWIRGKGAEQEHLDPRKLVVAGGSAGGYLTLLAGGALEPKPAALVAYYGYGDVDGEWYTKPSEHYRRTVTLYTREQALEGLGDQVVTGCADPAEVQARSRYYHYLRQNGLWTKEVTGFDPTTDRASLDPFCPVRNITGEYPPTLLLHGTADTDVPYERSVEMDRELERHHVAHEFLTLPGSGHGLAGGDRKLVAEAHEKAFAFIRSHLR